MALVTAAQIRTWVPQVAGSGEDATLDTLSEAAEGQLAAVCRFPRDDSGALGLATATYTDYLDGPDRRQSREVRLRVRPVVSVTSVHQSPTEDYGASDLIDSGDYMVDAPRGRLISVHASGHVWLQGYRWIRVIYTAGWGTSGNAPVWLQQAVAYQVAHDLTHRQTHGRSPVTQGGQTVADPSPHLGIDRRARQLVSRAILLEGAIG